MTISMEFGLVLIVQILTIGIFVGGAKTTMKFLEEKLTSLEKKQDKHNGLIERMVVVEQSTRSAHHRLDEIKGKR